MPDDVIRSHAIGLCIGFLRCSLSITGIFTSKVPMFLWNVFSSHIWWVKCSLERIHCHHSENGAQNHLENVFSILRNYAKFHHETSYICLIFKISYRILNMCNISLPVLKNSHFLHLSMRRMQQVLYYTFLYQNFF